MLAICLGCIALYAARKDSFWQRLQSEFHAGRHLVDFRELTDFGWDRVCVIPPYTILPGQERETLRANVRAELRNSSWKLPSQHSDEDWLFIFVEDDQIVSIEKNESFAVSVETDDWCMEKGAAFIRMENGGIIVMGRDAESRKPASSR